MKWNESELAEIRALQEKYNLTRKSAVQRFRRALKAQGKAAPESGTPDKPAHGNHSRRPGPSAQS